MQKKSLIYLTRTEEVPQNGYGIVSTGKDSYKMKLPKTTNEQKADYPVDTAIGTSRNMVTNAAVTNALNQKADISSYKNKGSANKGAYVTSLASWSCSVGIKPEIVNLDNTCVKRNSRGVDPDTTLIYLF